MARFNTTMVSDSDYSELVSVKSTGIATMESAEKTVSAKMTVEGYVEVKVIDTDVETYTGSYEVTAALEDKQKLPTRDKYMTDDVTVNGVPVHRMVNKTGGLTVFIGNLEGDLENV